MSTRTTIPSAVRSEHPLAAEFGLVVGVLVGVSLWYDVVVAGLAPALQSLPGADGLLVQGLLTGIPAVGGLALLAGGYVALRDVDVGLALPGRREWGLAGLATAGPIALVGLTKVVGVAEGIHYNSLTLSAYPADPPLVPTVVITGLGLLVAVPTLVVVCQVLVQGGFERVLGPLGAVLPTALLAGFAMTGSTGGLATVPPQGKVAGLVLLVPALALALYGADRVERPWLRWVSYVPVAVFVAGVAVGGVASVESVTGALFATTQVAVFGIAAYTYARSRSLVLPALSYLTLLLTSEAVVVLFEAGMQSW